jgi:hypothetical protein
LQNSSDARGRLIDEAVVTPLARKDEVPMDDVELLMSHSKRGIGIEEKVSVFQRTGSTRLSVSDGFGNGADGSYVLAQRGVPR